MGKPKGPAPQPIVPPRPAAPTEAPVEEGGGGGGGGGFYGPYNEVLSGYSEFAKTGGFSAADLANIRARAVSPVRAAYARAKENVSRQRALQGGYSPGAGVLQARMAREQGQLASDVSTGAEADIAKMVQEGRLAGLGGLAGLVGREGGGGGGGGGGGRGGGEDELETQPALVPEKKKGFWGKLGSGLKKIGQIALPVAATAFTGGLAAPLTAGLSGAGAKIGQSLLPKSWATKPK